MSAIQSVNSVATPRHMTGASVTAASTQKMSNLFDKIKNASEAGNTAEKTKESAGGESITKAQFEKAFNTMKTPAGFKSMGADAVFAKLDPNKTGSVSKQDFVKTMTQVSSQIRPQRHESVANQSPTQTPTQTVDTSLNKLGHMVSAPVIGSNVDTLA